MSFLYYKVVKIAPHSLMKDQDERIRIAVCAGLWFVYVYTIYHSCNTKTTFTTTHLFTLD
jgi:hypothetical protein